MPLKKSHSGIRMNESCPECDFSLFHPVGSFEVSNLGIYSDARFPGRSILMLNTHYDNIKLMPEKMYLQFCLDIRHAVGMLQKATGSSRINVSILGNSESHIHAHLIPRWPGREMYPGKSPWNDPRPQTPLTPDHLNYLKFKLESIFN